MTCPAHRTRLAVTAWPRGEERLAQEWVCQVCYRPCDAGDVVCGECGEVEENHTDVLMRYDMEHQSSQETHQNSDPPGAYLAVGSTGGSTENGARHD